MDQWNNIYKTHFVAKGFAQEYSINYEETFPLLLDLLVLNLYL
jgi:hypothetical protein